MKHFGIFDKIVIRTVGTYVSFAYYKLMFTVKMLKRIRFQKIFENILRIASRITKFESKYEHFFPFS